MTFDGTELRMVGIDERNLTTVHMFEEYLKKCLPTSEIIRDLFICVDMQMLLSDLYFFTDGLMIEIPDFVTYHQGKVHQKEMTFTIHPIRKAIGILSMKISESKGSRTVDVNFGLKKGDTFSFSAMKENSAKLEFITSTYLIPNLEND